MQEGFDCVSHTTNRILYFTDTGLDTIHDTIDDICSPAESRRSQILNEVHCISKAILDGIVNSGNGILNPIPHRTESSGHRRLNGIHNGSHRVLNAVPNCRDGILDSINHCGNHIFNVSAKYSCGFSNLLDSSIIINER